MMRVPHGTQVIRLGGRCSYPLSHLANTRILFSIFIYLHYCVCQGTRVEVGNNFVESVLLFHLCVGFGDCKCLYQTRHLSGPRNVF